MVKRFTKLKRGLRRGVKKASPFVKRGGELAIKGIKKATPIVKRQIRLIREQQLRDDKLEMLRFKRMQKRKKVTKQAVSPAEEIFAPLDF